MLNHTIEYDDYDGTHCKETLTFNLTKSELVEWEFSVDGGLSGMLKKIVEEKDVRRIAEQFKSLILKSYGQIVDTEDKKRKKFVKSEELSKEFSQTMAYDALYMSFFDKDRGVENAINFVRGVIPADIQIDEEAALAAAKIN